MFRRMVAKAAAAAAVLAGGGQIAQTCSGPSLCLAPALITSTTLTTEEHKLSSTVPSSETSPPPKKAQLMGLPKSQRDGPWAQKFAKKKENGIFGISASKRVRKIIICHVFGGNFLAIMTAHKIFFGAQVHDN